MAEPAGPSTPETLAERWRCSSAHVLAMIRWGELAHFRLGGSCSACRQRRSQDARAKAGQARRTICHQIPGKLPVATPLAWYGLEGGCRESADPSRNHSRNADCLLRCRAALTASEVLTISTCNRKRSLKATASSARVKHHSARSGGARALRSVSQAEVCRVWKEASMAGTMVMAVA
jgi:hypothetical protein